RGLLDEIHHDVLIRCIPVGLRRPMLAVPLRDATIATALMVLGGDRQRRDQAFSIEVLDLFHTLLELLGRQRLTVLFERDAGGFDHDRRAGYADVVIAAADVGLVTGAFAVGINLIENGLDHRVVTPVRSAFEA